MFNSKIGFGMEGKFGDKVKRNPENKFHSPIPNRGLGWREKGY